MNDAGYAEECDAFDFHKMFKSVDFMTWCSMLFKDVMLLLFKRCSKMCDMKDVQWCVAEDDDLHSDTASVSGNWRRGNNKKSNKMLTTKMSTQVLEPDIVQSLIFSQSGWKATVEGWAVVGSAGSWGEWVGGGWKWSSRSWWSEWGLGREGQPTRKREKERKKKVNMKRNPNWNLNIRWCKKMEKYHVCELFLFHQMSSNDYNVFYLDTIDSLVLNQAIWIYNIC